MSRNIDITAAVEVPLSIAEQSDVQIEQIPLPPPEMWSELDNAQPATSSDPTAEERQATKATTARPEVAKLNFVSRDVERTIALEFPFEDEQLGLVAHITVRRLTVGDLGNILDGREPNAPDNFDIYAAMTGISAPVLRGLIDVDGEEVSQVCYDFLPRIFRPREPALSSTLEAGAR